MTRRQFLAAAVTGVVGFAAGSAAVGTYGFDTEHVSRRVGTLASPLRVALLTDLHHGLYIREASVARWVDAALASEADLIVLAGDLVDRMPGGRIPALVSEIGRLRAPLGVYATWGNHDHARFDRLRPFEESLNAVGIEVLTNRGVSIRDDVFLAGLDDFRRGRPDVAAALRERPANGACLLVSHNPDALPHVPADVDLTLCGHTHGGQIRIPGVGAVLTSSEYGRRFLDGWVRGPALGYVSRGLGFSLLPLRIDCPAELTVMDLMP